MREWIDDYLDGDDESRKRIVKNAPRDELFIVASMFRSVTGNDVKKNLRQFDACPSDEDLASFVDLGERYADRTRVLEHIASCTRCRESIADAVRVGGDSTTALPAGLEAAARAKAEGALTPRGGFVIAIRRFRVPLAAVACVVAALTALVLVYRGPAQRDDTFAISAPPGVSFEAAREAEFLRLHSPILKPDVKGLLSVDDARRHSINERARSNPQFRERSLLAAGYHYFLLKNSAPSEPLEAHVAYGIAALTLDAALASHIGTGRYIEFEKAIRAVPERDASPFFGGYLLGALVVADERGAVDESLVARGEKLFLGSSINGTGEYVKSLRGSDAKTRAELRARIRDIVRGAE